MIFGRALTSLALLSLIGCSMVKAPAPREPTNHLTPASCALAEAAVEQMQMQPLAGLYATAKTNMTATPACSGAIALLQDWGWWPVVTDADVAFTDADAARLQARVDDWLNTDERYLGQTDDPWLSERLLQRFNRAVDGRSNAYPPLDISLGRWLDSQVDAGRISGYNLYQIADLPNFDPARSLFYGHSHPQHLRQLMALLKQQRLDAKVQLVPKRSVFVYLPEWGQAEYAVDRTASGKLLARPWEYDLYLQFDRPQARQQFLALVQRYAKRNSDTEPGLLTGAWWQPFIGTPMAAKAFNPLQQMLYSGQQLQARVILRDNSTALPNPPAGISAQRQPVWVNPAFYRYIVGAGFR